MLYVLIIALIASGSDANVSGLHYVNSEPV